MFERFVADRRSLVLSREADARHAGRHMEAAE
jgi:hypothetical protein